MGVFLNKFNANSCCLCGDYMHKPTGEHKIKASEIVKEFGNVELRIGTFGDEANSMRIAQSKNSKHFKFESAICEACNTSRTQNADREIESFFELARNELASDSDPNLVFNIEKYSIGSAAYLNIFRYFAKLLCCHMAEIGAPQIRRLSNFAIGKIDTNCVWLNLQEDQNYRSYKEKLAGIQYAAHGGLVVYGDKITGQANAFHSSLTIGPLQCVFHTRINWFEKMELKIFHSRFNKWCKAKVELAIEESLTNEQKNEVGL